LIAGLHEPTSGRIFFNDRDVTPLGTEKRNAVMCFQSYALWPHMNVRENIRFGLEIKKLGRTEQMQRVGEALDLVQMRPFADRKPNELSGGQQQRVALARALVVRPDCLLLDEPLSNLDAKLRLDMRTEIRRICRQAGLTAIYVTHDQKEALSIADRLAILSAGRIEQIGRPREVYLQPNSRFVANFIGETNFIEGTVSGATDGRVEIECAIGHLISTAPSQQQLSAGQAVTVSLRPEAIQLGEAGSDRANRFHGVVHDSIYLGEVAQHQVNLPATNGRSGEKSVTLKVFELNPQIVARDEATAQAGVWFDPRDVVILSR
jgi:iron(III) transport system ATP-binding protein